MLTIRISTQMRATAVARLAQRLTPTRYEEPNREQARRLAEGEARRLFAEIEGLLAHTAGRLVAPATVEV